MLILMQLPLLLLLSLSSISLVFSWKPIFRSSCGCGAAVLWIAAMCFHVRSIVVAFGSNATTTVIPKPRTDSDDLTQKYQTMARSNQVKAKKNTTNTMAAKRRRSILLVPAVTRYMVVEKIWKSSVYLLATFHVLLLRLRTALQCPCGVYVCALSFGFCEQELIGNVHITFGN